MMTLITQREIKLYFHLFLQLSRVVQACHYRAHPENKKEQWHEMLHDKWPCHVLKNVLRSPLRNRWLLSEQLCFFTFVIPKMEFLTQCHEMFPFSRWRNWASVCYYLGSVLKNEPHIYHLQMYFKKTLMIKVIAWFSINDSLGVVISK